MLKRKQGKVLSGGLSQGGELRWGQNGLQGLRSGAQGQAPGEPKIRVDGPEEGGGLAGDSRQKPRLCLLVVPLADPANPTHIS